MQLAETHYHITYPEGLAQLLKHLLSAAQQPFYECDHIENLVQRLIPSSASTPDLLQICHEMARLGCSRAAEIRGLLTNRR
jgi:hypothetical protein